MMGADVWDSMHEHMQGCRRSGDARESARVNALKLMPRKTTQEGPYGEDVSSLYGG